MNIPTVSKVPGATVAGKVSWFGGPNDAETGNSKTASGAPTSEPGIAIYNRATLGGYWRVTAANGKTAVLKQTDLGPAPFTGRAIDVTYSALGQLGYKESNFPTGATFKATYLGSNPSAAVASSAPASAPSVSTPSLPKGASIGVVKAATTTKALDLPALEAADRKVQANRFVADSFGGGEGNPLRGILDLTAPSPSSFETTSTTPAVLAPATGAVAASTGSAGAAQVPGLTAGGGGSAPISASAPADVKLGRDAPNPTAVSPAEERAFAEKTQIPAGVAQAKTALERASGHPVTLPELEKEVAAGTHGHYAVVAPTHGTVIGSYRTPSGQHAIVHHSNGKLEHVASTLPKGHQYPGGAVLGAPIGQQGG